MMNQTEKRLAGTTGLLALLGLLATFFIMATFSFDDISLMGVLISSGFVGLLSLSPIPIGDRNAILAHSIILASGLFYGPRDAVLGLAAGLAVGEIGRLALERTRKSKKRPLATLDSFASSYGQHAISLAFALNIYQQMEGAIPLTSDSFSRLAPLAGLTVGYLFPFLGAQWLKEFGQSRSPLTFMEFFTFVLIIGVLPLPYAILTAAAAAALGETALVILGGGPAVVAPIVRGLLLAERDLQRRLDELSTLGEVSQAMRTSLRLETILHTIYLQVAHLLEVRNFYIALFDPTENTLRYPLAIKGGSRQVWADRPLSDRLTDRVIQSGQPLLIQENAPSILRSMGMPELKNAPEAWLGVPLQTPDRVLGCLGVFHLEKPGAFSLEDQELLVTIAGQASVALENAMLYDQTRQRAHALASLNKISTQMSSSLDPEKTLRMVARSLIQVVGGDAAAIFLMNDGMDGLELAESHGLSEDFTRKYSTIDLADPGQSRVFHSGHPSLVIRGQGDNLQESQHAMLETADFVASVDLTLSTPSGPLGLATVFFDNPNPLADEQLELLETFVAQSALAVANAKAHAATDQALQRQVDQLSRLETIGRDMVSTLKPEDLFKLILESALEATGAPVGYLTLSSANSLQLQLVAHHGFSPSNQYISSRQLPVEQFGLAGKTFVDGQTILVDDVRLLVEHLDWTQVNTRSILSVPISRWGRVLGVLTVESEAIDKFGAEEGRFLSQVASYAAVAITNANLYQQLEENLREQSLLFQASAQITTSMDLKSVALAVADSLVVSIGASAAAVYSLHHRSGQMARLALVTQHESQREPLGHGLGSVQESIADAVSTGVPSSFELDAEDNTYIGMAIPLQVGATPIGALQVVFESPHEFSEAEIRTTQTIASQAAVAIQNTDLFRRIRESRDRLDAVINSTKEGILMVDQDGKVLLVNRQFQFLADVQEQTLVGNPLDSVNSNMIHKLQLSISDNSLPVTKVLSDLEAADSPTSIQIESPETRILERLVRGVTDASGGRIGWLIVLRDVSEQRELEETREQLVEMIVHDLRSPLSTIKGGISLLNQTLPEDKRSEITAQALSVSDRAVTQMLGLVNSLLDLARLENDPLEVKTQPLNLSQLLNELAEFFIPAANQAGLILDLGIAEDLPAIKADREKVRRVLSNLLDNAVKFTPEGGQINLSAQRDGNGKIQLTVSDDGPGVPEEMRERIFDRFSQVPGVVGRRRGTGLGLAFAKLAIEAHQGRIWVEPNNGQGSRFQILLPIEPKD